MTVHHPYSPEEKKDYSAGGSSFLALTGLSPAQTQCLVQIAERFAQDTVVRPKPPSPPYDYYIRGRKDLQLVHDAITWYSGELKKQYETTTIKMIEGIMWEGITRLDEMKQQIGITIDVLGEGTEDWK